MHTEETYQQLKQHVVANDTAWVERFLSEDPSVDMLMKLLSEISGGSPFKNQNEALHKTQSYVHDLYKLQHFSPNPPQVLIAVIKESQPDTARTLLERFTFSNEDYILAGHAAISMNDATTLNVILASLPSDRPHPDLVGNYITRAFKNNALDIATDLYNRFASNGQLAKHHYGLLLNSAILKGYFSFSEKLMQNNGDVVDRDYLHDAFININSFTLGAPEVAVKLTRILLPFCAEIPSTGVTLAHAAYPDKRQALFSLHEGSKQPLIDLLIRMACKEHNITPIDLIPDAHDWLKPAILNHIT